MTSPATRHKWIYHDQSGRSRTCGKCEMRVDRFGIGRTSYYTWSLPGGPSGDTSPHNGSEPIPGCLGYPDPHVTVPTIPEVAGD
jgi:hypothetical protein